MSKSQFQYALYFLTVAKNTWKPRGSEHEQSFDCFTVYLADLLWRILSKIIESVNRWDSKICLVKKNTFPYCTPAYKRYTQNIIAIRFTSILVGKHRSRSKCFQPICFSKWRWSLENKLSHAYRHTMPLTFHTLCADRVHLRSGLALYHLIFPYLLCIPQ